MLGMSGTGGMPGTGEFAIFFVFDGFAWLFVGLKVLKTTFSVSSILCARRHFADYVVDLRPLHAEGMSLPGIRKLKRKQLVDLLTR